MQSAVAGSIQIMCDSHMMCARAATERDVAGTPPHGDRTATNKPNVH